MLHAVNAGETKGRISGDTLLATHWFEDIIQHEVGGEGGGGWILSLQPRHGVSMKRGIFIYI